MHNQDRTLEIYEKHVANHEDSYLFIDDKETALLPTQKENLFVHPYSEGLGGSLDAHTTFYDNSEAYDLKTCACEKAFEGIGVVLQQTPDGAVVITHLVKGGPAAKSGQV